MCTCSHTDSSIYIHIMHQYTQHIHAHNMNAETTCSHSLHVTHACTLPHPQEKERRNRLASCWTALIFAHTYSLQNLIKIGDLVLILSVNGAVTGQSIKSYKMGDPVHNDSYLFLSQQQLLDSTVTTYGGLCVASHHGRQTSLTREEQNDEIARCANTGS